MRKRYEKNSERAQRNIGKESLKNGVALINGLHRLLTTLLKC